MVTNQRDTHKRELSTNFENWKLSLNAEKTTALLVTRRTKKELPFCPLLLNETQIEWDTNAKYLGLLFDKRLTFAQHFIAVIEKTRLLVKILYPLINRRSKLDMKRKILLYQTTLRPILTYGSKLTIHAATTNIKKLQRCRNGIIKMLFDLTLLTPN